MEDNRYMKISTVRGDVGCSKYNQEGFKWFKYLLSKQIQNSLITELALVVT